MFSRQRYWGEPIPLVYCEKCGDENGVVPLSEDQLPLTLPELESYEPTDTGESPLSRVEDWVVTTCPQCGGVARRETDTMPNWAGSCWYFLAYPWWQTGVEGSAAILAKYKKNSKTPITDFWKEVAKPAIDTWLPADWYLGGAEHAVLHLLYARFWVKVFEELGLLNFPEPFLRLRSVGMVLAEDGKKMSKSKGNVINPDDYVDKYGADSVRMYLMFMGPYEDGGPWDPKRFEGTHRFVNKIWDMITSSYSEISVDYAVEAELESKLHKLIKKVTEDVPNVRFNTAIASMMEFVNYACSVKLKGEVSADQWNMVINTFTKVMTPFAPFLAEELWEKLGNHQSVHAQAWPLYKENLVKDDILTIVIQVNGKLRDEFVVNSEDSHYKDELERMAKEKLGDKFAQMDIIKTVVVPGRLVNFVVR